MPRAVRVPGVAGFCLRVTSYNGDHVRVRRAYRRRPKLRFLWALCGLSDVVVFQEVSLDDVQAETFRGFAANRGFQTLITHARETANRSQGGVIPVKKKLASSHTVQHHVTIPS